MDGMIREIKFRAWDKNAYRMAEVTQIIFSKVQHTLVKYRYKTDNGKVKDEASHIDEKGHGTIVLMQYTGLKDKNGVEIYEGDIVKTYNGAKGVVKLGEYKDAEILDCIKDYYIDVDREERKTAGFFVEISDGDCSSLDNRTDKWIEIIGNIHENPELLEG